MEAGSLRDVIIIKAPPTEQNEMGEVPINDVTKWTDFRTLRAGFKPMIGREYFAAEAAQSNVEVKFTTRYVVGVTNVMRVYHKGIYYDILDAVNVDGRNRELLLYCKKVT